tara:strand:- start:5656 stop:5934 length:279 start_codon:yes stop_codon:yes gene_type:complete
MLSKKQLEHVCLLREGNFKTCRYCVEDDQDSTKWYCVKKTANKAVIDNEVQEYHKKMVDSGKDPKKQGFPLGDNCAGYPVLKYVEQGYDVDD